jgi:nitrile hydratase
VPHDEAHHHHPEPPSPQALRAKALESLLVEKGLVSHDAIDRVIRTYEQDIGPMIGARLVARAWADPGFRQRLLADATQAVAESGFAGRAGEALTAVENTPAVHNVICCTLCSCYPWSVLGLPPAWYKDPAYRSRIVIEPRRVLAEFGLELGPDIEVRVWDSSAQMRYIVIPQRPAGTEGWSEGQLAELVTRDSMIGVARAREPAAR